MLLQRCCKHVYKNITDLCVTSMCQQLMCFVVRKQARYWWRIPHKCLDDNSMDIKTNKGVVLSKADILQRLEASVERATGQRVETLRNQTLTQMRRTTEARIKHGLRFCSRFPLIGRGNVMRGRIVDHESVESLLASILK